ncbi:PEP-CTERM-box response regulator transcription factor [Motiliproteus sediminis]|uniref:PEP-CTERM-box response regulator transcription factor n=1 Tax=Motiliproteus sediminis TaxID=1468178 RepID=UPI0031BAD5ED
MAKDKERKTLLIVEDDLGLQKQMKWCLEGYELVFADNREDAIKEVRRHEPDVITLDLGLPPDLANATEGLAALEQILALHPNAKVIVITGNDDHSNAVTAIGMGAYDFYHKPIEPETLGFIVQRAFRLRQLEEDNRRLAQAGGSVLQGVIGTSDAMAQVCKMVERIAPTNIGAMLLGESGTGKEVLARALHQMSDRSEGRFVAINCASIPENLLESELFGYEKGAFTGAVKQTLGKIELAHNGTLFLDEIGDMPIGLQAKLLRFLQEKTIERIGGREEIEVDVRIISATHQNLEEHIAQGSFREDLFYRLSEFVINIPPLRQRDGDAVLIARAFLSRIAGDLGGAAKGFTDGACRAISSYAWPGNIRELENKVKRAAIMCDTGLISEQDMGLVDGGDDNGLPLNLKQAREEVERRLVLKALSLSSSNVSKTAELLGITRPTLYGLMEKHGLTTEA